MTKQQPETIILNNQIENKLIFLEMQRAKTTILNDAVTLRQFNRFLPNAKLPPHWQGSVEKLEDVLKMPIIIQDKLFADWICEYLKKDPNFPKGMPYPNNQYLMKQMSIQRLYKDIQSSFFN